MNVSIANSNVNANNTKYQDRQEKGSSLVLCTAKGLSEYLYRSRADIAAALPAHITPERMISLAVTCFSNNPMLQSCSPASILSSLVIASQLGLEPGVGGQGYLIPDQGRCSFVPGWQGIVGLLHNTGRATAWTGCVYEGDQFQFELGMCPVLRHVPGEFYGEVDRMSWVYACGKVHGADMPVIEAWPMPRIMRYRDEHNGVGEKHYSYRFPEMYARKVVLLQVLKYMPRSVEVNNAIEVTHAAEVGRSVQIQNGVVIQEEAVPEEVQGWDDYPLDRQSQSSVPATSSVSELYTEDLF